MKKTAAWLMRRALEEIGVRRTFGIPGVHTIELYDELNSSELIEPVLVTHEAGGAFMADAISRVSDEVGTLVIVPAAGLTHAMSGIGEAYLDGIPMLVISGGIRTDIEQGFQLHDVDQQAMMKPLTKACFRIERYDQVVETVYEAYRTAISGEPGPVYIELPANLQLLAGDISEVPAFEPPPGPAAMDPETIQRAAQLLTSANHPGIFVGWGARQVIDDIRRIAEHLGAPVATTLQGLASFPGDHPLHTGMGFGPASVPASENAFQKCDAMLAVGTRFAEIATGSYGAVPPENLVHIDINPDAIGRNYPASEAICADAREAVPLLADAITSIGEKRPSDTIMSHIREDKQRWKEEWLQHDSGDRVNPARFFGELRGQLNDDAIVVADDGNHTFMVAELLPIHAAGLYCSPTDFNCMGYCIPAATAAGMAQPGRQVVGIVGDGAAMMTGLEAATASQRDIGVAWFVFNDGELSQIAQAQETPYQRTTCTTVAALDFGGLAQATGCEYISIANDSELKDGIRRALEFTNGNRPVFVDVRIDYSKKTRFTEGVVKTNLKRFDTRNKLRIVGRAIWRKFSPP